VHRTKAVLIIGGSGFIGTHLALKLRETYKVFLTYNTHPVLIPGTTPIPFNVEGRDWAKRLAYTTQPLKKY
jgi:nucleoside-diphosphate-sugar epimerase